MVGGAPLQPVPAWHPTPRAGFDRLSPSGFRIKYQNPLSLSLSKATREAHPGLN